MRYFQLMDDVNVPGGWILGTPTDARTGQPLSGVFLKGQPLRVTGPVRAPFLQPGRALDFSLADTAPVVHAKVASVLAELAPTDVQLIPANVDTQPEQYCLLNVLRVVKCIDDAACEEVNHWTPEDGVPEKTGQYFSVYGLRIDPTQVGGVHLFRPWGWEIALIVSESIKEAMQRLGVTGARFDEV
ncbi:imm11 family protein [Archangium violaceum]|uniref:Immunity MXAN-0049 protein domain-containing protein n=1 Tax=Archangium violaceum Cb vi76 TaxID=1406225 RepID=A0A084T081_9BACT|nr:DUF1629 domain-containing protein [Archangium violaceum]KFA94116.1 hypothetical protein Q664_04925 [Archangium violaceum Cb vi76]